MYDVKTLLQHWESNRCKVGRFYGPQYKLWLDAYRDAHAALWRVLLSEPGRPQGIRWHGDMPMQWPSDLIAYGELIHETRPRTIIETGTCAGGLTRFLVERLAEVHTDDNWRVVTVDVRPDVPKLDDEHIVQMIGDCVSDETSKMVSDACIHPVMVVLDSDHGAAHVLREMNRYAASVPSGGYMIVNDTRLGLVVDQQDVLYPAPNGRTYHPDPLGAVEVWLDFYDSIWEVDLWASRWLLTQNPFGFLRRK